MQNYCNPKTKTIIKKYNMINIILYTFILIILLLDSFKLSSFVPVFVLALLSIAIGDMVIYCISQEVDKESFLVSDLNSRLSSDKLAKVIPKKMKDSIYENFILDLSDIANFYANFDKESGKVKVFVRFNSEHCERLLESINIVEFSERYVFSD